MHLGIHRWIKTHITESLYVIASDRNGDEMFRFYAVIISVVCCCRFCFSGGFLFYFLCAVSKYTPVFYVVLYLG